MSDWILVTVITPKRLVDGSWSGWFARLMQRRGAKVFRRPSEAEERSERKAEAW